MCMGIIFVPRSNDDRNRLGLVLVEDFLKLLAYMVQFNDMQASNVDGCKFVLASNEDRHGNHVVVWRINFSK